MSDLIRYDAMCRAIAEAHAVDEVKDIRDRAIALEVYSRQAHNFENELRACQIRLRAERKAGRLSKQLDKTPGARTDREPLGTAPRGSTKREVLEAAGITTDQAKRWEKLADVPDDQFEAALAGPEKPTTTGIIEAAKPKTITPVSRDALWLWGRLNDFRRDGVIDREPADVLSTMTQTMRTETLALAPQVAAWLQRIGGIDGGSEPTSADRRADYRDAAE